MENTENTAEQDQAESIETVDTAKVDTDEVSEDSSESPHDNVEQIKTETEEYKEKYYYLAAEMQNAQKRFEREKQNLIKFGNEKLLNDMVDVVDNLERTLGFIEADEDEKVKNIIVGIDMIKKMFLENLGKHGLKQIEALGAEFDPNFHEALAQQPAEGKEENTVILVHQNGYLLNDRVIRAAKVIIVKNN